MRFRISRANWTIVGMASILTTLSGCGGGERKLPPKRPHLPGRCRSCSPHLRRPPRRLPPPARAQ